VQRLAAKSVPLAALTDSAMKRKILISILLFVVSMAAISQTSNPEVGAKAPLFAGTDQNGKQVSLSQLLSKGGSVVLLFYRGHWCPFCNKQLNAMQDSITFFREKNASIIAITPETPPYIKKTVAKTDASFSIIYDKDNTIMKQYGVNFTLDATSLARLKNVGIDIAAINGNDQNQLPIPAVFIIQPNGVITYVHFDPNYRLRPSVRELLQYLK
jgi:peroxiredoxin